MSVNVESMPGLTRRQALWLACKPKTCCYQAMVVPTGRDVWRISRTLNAPPWTYLVYFRSPQPRRDAFRLDRSDATYRLLLAKGVTRRTKAPAPCIFLLRARDGSHRCGLDTLRPMVCQTFPVDVIDGVVCVQSQPGCTCRAWAVTDMDTGVERQLVARQQREAEEYCAVVARWNALVDTAPPEAAIAFPNYCDFLLAAYDALPNEAEADEA